jgi:threonine/homoserine/homoserine lactone efflux protein
MTDWLSFTLGAIALLATPGPTNTLLATSGAASGLRNSLGLLLAELAGYLIAIAILIGVVGPLVAYEPAFGMALRIAAGVYLLYVATGLWNQGELTREPASAVSFIRVFVATLLNPKALIFAFTLIPAGIDGSIAAALPWLAGLVPLIAGIGLCWIAAGKAVRRAGKEHVSARMLSRAGAVVLAVFASFLGGSAISAGWS